MDAEGKVVLSGMPKQVKAGDQLILPRLARGEVEQQGRVKALENRVLDDADQWLALCKGHVMSDHHLCLIIVIDIADVQQEIPWRGGSLARGFAAGATGWDFRSTGARMVQARARW